MKLKQNNHTKRCDLGTCGNAADYTVCAGHRSEVPMMDICNRCLAELAEQAKKCMAAKAASPDNIDKKAEGTKHGGKKQ